MAPEQKDFRENLRKSQEKDSQEKDSLSPVTNSQSIDHSDYHTPSQSPEKEASPPRTDLSPSPAGPSKTVRVITPPPETIDCANGESFEIAAKV